jgi:hypothetical protein
MTSPLDLEYLKLKIFKVSVRNHCPCDMIKNQKRGWAVMRNGNHTNQQLARKKSWLAPQL